MSTASIDRPGPHGPGLRSLLAMVRCEIRMVVRDTAGLIVPIGLPLAILLVPAGGAGDEVIAHGLTALDLFVVPLMLVMVLCMVGVLNMPSFLAYYRRTGILRRLAVTPASPLMVLVAQVIVSILQSALGIAIAAGVAMVALGANAPLRPGAAVGMLALTAAAMYATGMVVAATAPTPNAAIALGLIGFLVLGATGGMFGGIDNLPEPVAEIGRHLPFGAGVEALSSAWAGEPVDAGAIIALSAAIVIGVGIAAWLFRWE